MARTIRLSPVLTAAFLNGIAVLPPFRIFLPIVLILVAVTAVAATAVAATAAPLEEPEERISKLENKSTSECVIDQEKRLGIKCPNWSASVLGRIYVDMMAFSEDKHPAADNKAGLKDTSNTGIRTARIGMVGNYQNSWGFKLEGDFSDNSQLKDAYLAYLGIKGLKIKLGNAKVPYSMEELTSSRYINFIEKVTPGGFSPSRVIGLAAFYGADDWSLGASVHGDKGNKATYQADWGGTVRGSWAPFYAKGEHYLHLGLGVRRVNYSSRDKLKVGFTVRSPFSKAFDFKSAKGTGLSDVDEVAGVGAGKSVSCVGCNADNNENFKVAFNEMLGWNAELAGGYRSMGFKSQYLRSKVDTEAIDGTIPADAAVKKDYETAKAGLSNGYDFNSWYVEGNWWITGEANAYDPKKGSFARIKPLTNLADGGIGAIGVALRYNEVEFGDRKDMAYLKCDDGCKANVWTFNITWKPNPYVKFMGEYVTATRERIAAAKSKSFEDKPTAYQFRAMVDF